MTSRGNAREACGRETERLQNARAAGEMREHESERRRCVACGTCVCCTLACHTRYVETEIEFTSGITHCPHNSVRYRPQFTNSKSHQSN